MALLHGLGGQIGIYRTLELGQAISAFIDECRTEGFLEEGDGEGDAYGEPDQELDPEEERVGSNEGTFADDRTDEASKGLVICAASTESEAPRMRDANSNSPEEAEESEDGVDNASNDETGLHTTFQN